MQLTIDTPIALSPDQENAADMIRGWLGGDRDELIVAGYAGTGKSTVIKAVYPELRDAGCLFVTPSAKAAYVLQAKGVPACTIHSAIYLFGGVRETSDGDELPIFHEREGFSEKLPIVPKRFVVDEASMVDEKVYYDLKSKELPTLWIGDSGQLPPVGSDPRIMQRPHVSLTKIHRQSLDSGILRIAHDVREGGRPAKRHACDDVEIVSLANNRLVAQHAVKHGYDQVICAYNNTRHEINKAMRFALRKRGALDVGDKLLCRFNNRRTSIFNGMQFVVVAIHNEETSSFTADLRIDLGGGVLGPWRRNIKIQKISLGNPNYVGSERVDGCVEFDYGYCITAHSSQGSQWRSTLVAYQDNPRWSMARWGYTALTRAESKLGVVT